MRVKMFQVYIPETAPEAVKETLLSGYITEGPKVKKFESLMSEYLGNPNIGTVNNCTSALTLSLILSGVKPGDEVITTPMTCIASNIPIKTLGATIVWADIDPKTGNISSESIRSKITSKTKAILYVHWAGQPADITQIQQIADQHGLKVIEDAAHALGSEYGGKRIGNHGDFVCFSFQAIKHLTTVDGGLVAMQNKPDMERLHKMRWYGLDRNFNRSVTKWETDIDDIGFKMHMNDVTATIGIEQMNHIDRITSIHRDNALFYDDALQGVDGIELLKRQSGSINGAWLYTLKLESDSDRDLFAKHMISHEIDCGVVHVRNDKYSVFSEFESDLPGVDDFCSRMINIPCGWWVTPKLREYVVEIIRKGW